MKKATVLFCLAMLLLGGCKKEEFGTREQGLQPPKTGTILKIDSGEVGRFGDDIPITRGEGAKMIALAFHSPEAIKNMPYTITFQDVSPDDWYAPYINTAVADGYLAGEGETFLPESPITLEQMQVLMERINPDNKINITINDDNREKSVAYSLWLELFGDALQGRRKEDSLYSYGIQEREQVLLDTADRGTTVLMEDGIFTSTGRDLEPLVGKKIRILTKEREITAIEEVLEESPVIENAFFRKVKEGIAVDTGEGSMVYTYAGKEELPESGIADMQIQGQNIVNMTVLDKMDETVLKKVTQDVIELQGRGVLEWADNAKIYEKTEDGIVRRPVTRLISGTDMADYYERDGKVGAAVIVREAIPETIRVLLSNTGFTSHDQKNVILTVDTPFTITGGGVTKSYGAGEEVTITPEQDLGVFGAGRAIVTPEEGGIITVKSISRNGEAPSYRGTLEIERRGDTFLLVNALPFEEYLKGVVPWEMPVSFGIEPLKVQAVSARSYAYNQFYENRYGAYGANVDDSTASQVYNGSKTQEISDRAVEETRGVGLTYGDKVVNANFYSTSAGVTANSGEVWAGDNGTVFPWENRPYLISKRQGLTEDPGDLREEEKAAAFFKNWNVISYDSASPWFRWKTTLPKEVITQLEKRMQEVAEENRNFVEVLQPDGSWKAMKPQNLGAIQDIAVTERGEGGNAMYLTITGENGTARVVTEYAIRRVLRPVKEGEQDVILELKDGSEKINYIILPSSFMVVEQEKTPEGSVESITLYGGGNGHGVGMSQYGAKGMAEEGFTYQEILEHYFPGAKAQTILGE